MFFHCLLFAEEPRTYPSKRAVFLEFLNFYEAIHPAQENNADAYAWFSTVPNPFLNVVIHLSTSDADARVDELIQQNSPSNPMTFWVHPENHVRGLADLLKKRNFHVLVTCPAMTWTVHPVPFCHADIRPADQEIFWEIVSTVYELNEIAKKECPKLLDKLECENYLFYSDGIPISTASLFVHGAVGEIFNDATLVEGGRAPKELMQFLMHRAHERGLERLIVLSYPEAEKSYQDLGFETLFDVEIYCR